MTRCTGPLFSISASGSLAKLVTYRATARGSIAQSPPVPRAAPSPAQLSERARCRAYAGAWISLDAGAKDAWRSLATARFSNPYLEFFREATVQQIVPPAVPLIPYR